MLKQLLLALKRLLRALGPVLVGCIFLGAVYLLYREISKYSLADIRMSLAQISTGSIILSVLLAIINYIILIGYDWLALKGIHKTLPVSRVSLVSFVGQAVSYNFGALLGGSTVRFRFYSSWGFSPMDIVRLVLMLAITFWVGALGLVGAIFMIAPPEIPPELGMHMPLDIRPLGAILFLIAISYLIVCKFIHKPIHIFGKEFAFPPFKIAVAQAVVAGADLVAAGRVEVHMIGHLQRNKVKNVVGKVAMIESVGSLELLSAIDKQAEKLGIVQDILLEVNIGGEEAKSGFAPGTLNEAACYAKTLPHVRVLGLMTIPPVETEPHGNMPFFARMKALYVDINKNIYDNKLKYLSMGMSGDYAEAIEAGSNMVRVGTAIFGARNYSK